MNMVPTGFFFKHLGDEKTNAICNYNSVTKLNFRRLISIEFTLLATKFDFRRRCNGYGANRFFL
jgi:hypothetical protein